MVALQRPDRVRSNAHGHSDAAHYCRAGWVGAPMELLEAASDFLGPRLPGCASARIRRVDPKWNADATVAAMQSTFVVACFAAVTILTWRYFFPTPTIFSARRTCPGVTGSSACIGRTFFPSHCRTRSAMWPRMTAGVVPTDGICLRQRSLLSIDSA
jgi:hypothetical protein